MSETPSVKKKGLQPKDLINIGIFTALYFIIIMAVAMLGYVPIFIPLLSVILSEASRTCSISQK